MSKTKGQKFKTAALTILFIAVVFFGTYGVSRVQLSLLGKENIYGYVEANEWDERMTFDADAYFSLTVNEGGTLKVLMLTDTHFKNGGWYANYFWVGEAVNRGAYADIKKLVKDAAPDFIYLTGDIETASLNDLIFEEFGAFMDGFKIPWTMTMGNHDAENRADKAKVAEILLAAEYCVLDVGFTNLNGLGNTVIPVKDGNGRILYAFI
ncbi:MAG: metallophosphoesterase, partial [Clostridiales bacterium]|nr:metallophosphoesterase [Clostridiales bacterium]